MTWAIALIVRPFIILILVVVLFAPAVYAVKRWVPEGKLKRFLLYKLN